LSNYIAVSKKKYPKEEYNIVKCNNCGFTIRILNHQTKNCWNFYNTNYLEKHTNVWHHFEDNLNHEIARLLIRKVLSQILTWEADKEDSLVSYKKGY